MPVRKGYLRLVVPTLLVFSIVVGFAMFSYVPRRTLEDGVWAYMLDMATLYARDYEHSLGENQAFVDGLSARRIFEQSPEDIWKRVSQYLTLSGGNARDMAFIMNDGTNFHSDGLNEETVGKIGKTPIGLYLIDNRLFYITSCPAGIVAFSADFDEAMRQHFSHADAPFSGGTACLTDDTGAVVYPARNAGKHLPLPGRSRTGLDTDEVAGARQGIAAGVELNVPGELRYFYYVADIPGMAGSIIAGYWQVLGSALFLVVLASGATLVYILWKRSSEARAAEERERFYRGLVEASQDGILVVEDRKVVWANRRAAKTLGFTAAVDMTGASLRDFYDTATNERIEKLSYPILQKEGSFNDKVMMKTSAGEEIVCSLRITLLEQKKGLTYPRVLLTIRDITREEALKSEVMRYVRMEALGRMAGGIAHNFNNLLGGIMGYASLLQECVTDKELSRYVSTILDACRQGSELTNRLLTFARGTKQPRSMTAPHTLLEDAENLIQPNVPHDVHIQRHCPEDLPMINVAAGEVVHALVNVIKNSVEAMPSGGLLILEGEKIEISQEHSERLLHLPPGGYICFSVTDTGTGIPVEHIDKIFEPFFSTKERKTGTGLGLSMVYATVREHGGEVRVYSEPGSGTIVRIYLPIGEAPRSQETEDRTRATAPPDPARLVGLKVLVLEDDEAIKNFLEDFFTRKGSIVEVAATIADFRKALDETRFLPDVVILDMVLPDGSGASLLKDLRAKLPKVKTIAISGYSSSGQARLMVDEGANIFLQKPFNAAQVLEAIQSVMSMDGDTGKST